MTMQTDVLIVGGGMVGACSALTLANLGLSVTVVERFEPKAVTPESPMGLRVSALNLASEKLLRQVKSWPAIDAARHCVYRRLGVWEEAETQVIFDAAEIEQTHLGHIIENDVIQYALWQQCETHPDIDCVISKEIAEFCQSAEKVSLKAGQQLIEANLLLACDGGHSQIRKLAGIGVEGWQYGQHALVVGIETNQASQDITWQQMSSTGPKAFLPLAQGKGSLVWYHCADEVKRLKALPKAQLKQAICKAFPSKLVDFEIEQVASFPLTRQHAQNYVQGKVVLLGDSAHLINPLAGQGVNLGFKDVAALEEVIAKALKAGEAWSNPEVLNSYERKRKLDNLTMMSAMDAIYATFSNENPILKVARQAGLTAVKQLPLARKLATQYACGVR